MANKTYETIQDIIAFSNSAIKLYDKLAELEYNGLVGSKEYYECIDLLRYIQEYEDKRYSQIKFDTIYVQDLMERMAKENNVAYEDMLFTLCSINDDALGIKRFLSKSQTIAAKRNETMVVRPLSEDEQKRYKEQIEKELGCEIDLQSVTDYYDDYDQTQDPEYQTELKEEKMRNEVEILRNEALSHTYIAYLNDYIKNTTSPELKKELIKVKYRTIGFNKPLEDYFLERGPQFLMPKLFQRCIEVDIDKKKNIYSEVYLDFLQAEIEEAINELDSILNFDLPLNEGGLYAIVESIYTRACNSINPSYELESSLEVLKQNALKLSKTDYAKEKIMDSFKLKKELTMSKNVDL